MVFLVGALASVGVPRLAYTDAGIRSSASGRSLSAEQTLELATSDASLTMPTTSPAAAPYSPDIAPELRVLTLNAWGLPTPLSQDRKKRLKALCQRFWQGYLDMEQGWDVIFLQEMWKKSDRRRLKKCGYPYSADQDKGGFADGFESGLIILSRHPILPKSARKHVYKRNGLPQFFFDGEIFSEKSVLTAKIRHPALGPILLATTHLVSYYSHYKYRKQRRDQMKELARFIQKQRLHQQGPYTVKLPVVMGGDLNFGPHAPTYEPLWDLLSQILPGFQTDATTSTDCTVCANNPYVEKDEGKIDHIFASPDFVLQGGRPFDEGPYSDHFGWQNTLLLRGQ